MQSAPWILRYSCKQKTTIYLKFRLAFFLYTFIHFEKSPIMYAVFQEITVKISNLFTFIVGFPHSYPHFH